MTGGHWVRQESGRAHRRPLLCVAGERAAPGHAAALGRMHLKPSSECLCYSTSSASIPGASDRRMGVTEIIPQARVPTSDGQRSVHLLIK